LISAKSKKRAGRVLIFFSTFKVKHTAVEEGVHSVVKKKTHSNGEEGKEPRIRTMRCGLKPGLRTSSYVFLQLLFAICRW